jgi:hypothetical protein
MLVRRFGADLSLCIASIGTGRYHADCRPAASTQGWSQVFHTDQQAGTVLIDHDKAELAQRG